MKLIPFLKPDFKKILVFIGLCVILYFIIISTSCTKTTRSDYCLVYEHYTFIVDGREVVTSWAPNAPMIIHKRITELGSNVIIVSLPILYILSCYVVWIYNKKSKQ